MNERERQRETELTNSQDGYAMRERGGGLENKKKKRAERLEIEIYDTENDYDRDRGRSLFARPSLVAVNLAMRADQTKIGCSGGRGAAGTEHCGWDERGGTKEGKQRRTVEGRGGRMEGEG